MITMISLKKQGQQPWVHTVKSSLLHYLRNSLSSSCLFCLRFPSIEESQLTITNCPLNHVLFGDSKLGDNRSVSDFVPVFFGQEYLELPPMNDDQLKNLDVIITVNSTGEDGRCSVFSRSIEQWYLCSRSGVIFETTRRPSAAGEDPAINTRPPSLKHQARISNGLLVYEYDVGYGKGVSQYAAWSEQSFIFSSPESIASPIVLDSRHWNTIHLRNNDSKGWWHRLIHREKHPHGPFVNLAVLQLNSGPAIEKVHHPLRWQKGSNSPIILGAHIEANDRDAVRDGFKGSIIAHELPSLISMMSSNTKLSSGVISSVTVSGEPLNLGSVSRSPHMVSFDSCRNNLCQHSSRCRNANTPKVVHFHWDFNSFNKLKGKRNSVLLKHARFMKLTEYNTARVAR